MPRISVGQAGGQNVLAFLDMLRYSEIGAEGLLESDDGYNVLVGSVPGKMLLFPSYADHPNVFNRDLDSDAAGGYQIMHRWWPAYKAQLHLPDFSPESQDLYAVQQLRERHALPLLGAGSFEAAVHAVSNIWASLPGSQYGQHVNQMDNLLQAYLKAGGVAV